MAHIERINWTDSVPDVAKIAEGNIGGMHYGPDETLRRNRPFELPKGPVMLLDSLGIYGPNGNIQRRLRTEPCKNARSCVPHWAC
jgi:hypothetical protein